MSDNEKESKDLELFHYGVKGMRWGVRRKSGGESSGDSKGRTGIRQRIRDRDDKIKEARKSIPDAYSKEAAATVNSLRTKGSLLKNVGNSEKKAEAKSASQDRRSAAKNRKSIEKTAAKLTSKELAVKGALYVGPALAGTATLASAALATRNNTRLGREFSAGLFSDSRGLTTPGTIALQYIDGVWQ